MVYSLQSIDIMLEFYIIIFMHNHYNASQIAPKKLYIGIKPKKNHNQGFLPKCLILTAHKGSKLLPIAFFHCYVTSLRYCPGVPVGRQSELLHLVVSGAHTHPNIFENLLTVVFLRCVYAKQAQFDPAAVHSDPHRIAIGDLGDGSLIGGCKD